MKLDAQLIRLWIALVLGAWAAPAFADVTTTATPPPVKEWTILVFLNGHNDLDQFGEMNINSMERVGSSPDVNVVVQWASMGFSTTKRILVQKDTDSYRVTSPMVNDPGLVDMGDYRSLVEFVRWAKVNYPAKHYFIDVWNHGSGWHKRFGYLQGPADKDISLDDRFNTKITTKELGIAMREAKAILGQKVDIYGSDACLMAMAEVAGEMDDSVKLFIGAEEVEPGEGWPYDRFLGPLVARPTMTAEELARIHNKAYLDAYSDGDFGTQDVTMSTLNLEKFAAFEAAMTTFAAEVKGVTAMERGKLVDAAGRARAFYTSDYKDLVDFLDKLSSVNVSGVKVDTIATLRAAAKDMVLANEVSDAYRSAHGLAFWLPTRRMTYNSYATRYSELSFAQSTKWGDALNQFLPAF